LCDATLHSQSNEGSRRFLRRTSGGCEALRTDAGAPLDPRRG
jgi:hypothetical protein